MYDQKKKQSKAKANESYYITWQQFLGWYIFTCHYWSLKLDKKCLYVCE